MTTWNTANPAQVIDAMNTLSNANWPMQEPACERFLLNMGWGLYPDGEALVTNFGLTPGLVHIAGLRGDTLDISFTVCDVFPSDETDTTKTDFVHDLFTAYTGHFTQAWGKPIKRLTQPQPEIWWNSGNDCIVALRRDTPAPFVEFYTPNGVPLLKTSIT